MSLKAECRFQRQEERDRRTSTMMAKTSKKKYILVIGVLWGIILVFMYSFSIPKTNFIFTFEEENPTKYVLYYTAMFGNKAFNLGLGSEIFEKCPYNKCFATHNRSLMPIDKFDAVLFHGIEVRSRDLNEIYARSPHQVYVYSNQESPLNTPGYMNFPRHFFNWTMTYRMDSDILRTYGYVLKKNTSYRTPTADEMDRKQNRIAWFVSNCVTYSKRELVAMEIAKYYPVDVYGSCGNLTCAKRTPEQCYTMLESDYKYYFSAENSLCDDYVTEKTYNILQKNVIPLVYGYVRYNTLTPPHSVIDVSEFDTAEELVSYLKFLDASPEEYLRYFEWKKRYVIDTTSQATLCTLCEKLHKPLQYQSYEDISGWWFGEKYPACKYSENLPKIAQNSDQNVMKSSSWDIKEVP